MIDWVKDCVNQCMKSEDIVLTSFCITSRSFIFKLIQVDGGKHGSNCV